MKPPAGFYSVKGVGMTQPDPGDTGVTPTGAVIPFGKGKTTANEGASDSLLYNEYPFTFTYEIFSICENEVEVVG